MVGPLEKIKVAFLPVGHVKEEAELLLAGGCVKNSQDASSLSATSVASTLW